MLNLFDRCNTRILSQLLLAELTDLIELNLNNNEIFMLWGEDFHTPRLKRLHLHNNLLQYLPSYTFKVRIVCFMLVQASAMICDRP